MRRFHGLNVIWITQLQITITMKNEMKGCSIRKGRKSFILLVFIGSYTPENKVGAGNNWKPSRWTKLLWRLNIGESWMGQLQKDCASCFESREHRVLKELHLRRSMALIDERLAREERAKYENVL